MIDAAMRGHVLRLLSTAAIVAAVFMSVGLLGCASSGRPHAQSGAPPRLLDVDGHPVDFSTLSAPVTVVIFTRTDCPVSNRFAPEIVSLYKQFHPRGAEFYLVYVDPTEEPAAIRRHLADYGLPCRAVRDPDHTLVARCKATITPEAAVFDRANALVYLGRINDLYVDLGRARTQASTHELADAIDATFQGKPVPEARTRAVGCTIADLAAAPGRRTTPQ